MKQQQGIERDCTQTRQSGLSVRSIACQYVSQAKNVVLASAPVLERQVAAAGEHVCNVQVMQPTDGRWQPEANSCTATVTYTSTTHSGVSYRPSTASTRPSTAHPSSPRAVPNSRQARPASARESSGRHSLAVGLKDKASMLPGIPVVVHSDKTHLQITKLVHSKGYRSVSPMSEGSTGATPSPAQTPCSVLSRPNTAGRGNSHLSCAPV